MTVIDKKLAVVDAVPAIEPIRPVSRSSTSDIVYERLREVILNVTILPHAVISENELAKRFRSHERRFGRQLTGYPVKD